MKTAILALVLAIGLASCAYLQPASDKIGSAVKEYCTQPLDARRTVRAQVNKSAAPNTVIITCAGDPA